MIEEWKDIKGFEGLYMVSSFGRVKSLPRQRATPKGGRYMTKETILKGFTNKGYVYVLLYKDGKNHSKKVHRLVAQTFIPNPSDKPHVNHLDYDKTNNRLENLEWATCQENIDYSAPNKARQHNCNTKSGERYISMRHGRFRVCITKHRVDKEFDCLKEAIAYRNERLAEYDYKI